MMWMGATHFLMKTLPNVVTEMALHVLAYNLTRVMNIVGIKPLLLRSGRGEACALGRAKRPDEHALLVGIMLLIAHVLSFLVARLACRRVHRA